MQNFKKILLIGSGPIVIGQACEFDYSSSIALKTLKNLGYSIFRLELYLSPNGGDLGQVMEQSPFS